MMQDNNFEDAAPSRPAGRPRSEETRQAILTAAYALMQEDSLDSVTMDRIAARAGAGKATLYRWWQNRESLIVDALYAATITEIQFPDTGSVREDFREQLTRLMHLLQGAQGSLILTLAAEARREPVIAAAWQKRWVQQRQQEALAAIQRGIARGEISPDLDTRTFLEILYSPLYRRLLMQEPLSTEFVNQIVDTVMDGVVQR